jgi:Uncharacterized protein conserved in bacteria (DUF2252)
MATTKTHAAKMPVVKMNIQQATRSYEAWMRSCTTVIEADLRSKHAQMREDPFLFFRGTFYRWAQLWPDVCPDLRTAPKVLAVGDLHVGSFGTWRDEEGRMSWGVDDFDESFLLPYTNDLVRLTASVKMGIDAEKLTIRLKDACDAIVEGYERSLKEGGCPIVLAERERNLEKLGIAAIKPPPDFWEKLIEHPAVNVLPPPARQALEETLPDKKMDYKVVRREAGLGSLGQQRFVAIADWQGGCIAREAKAMVPSACLWLAGNVSHLQSNYQKAIKGAVRSHDPYQMIVGAWLIRRLSPDSNPIEIDDLPKERDEEALLHAMGSETANVHLGSGRVRKKIVKDLRRRKSNWLRTAAKDMAKAVEHEWKEYRKN